MQDAYFRLIELIGKRIDDPLVKACLESLGEEPQEIASRLVLVYLFKQHGIDVMFHNSVLDHVFVHIGTTAVKSGQIEPFALELPGGIVRGDSRADVQRKLGKRPFQANRTQGLTPQDVKDYGERYRQGRYELTVTYRGGTQLVSSLATRIAVYRPPIWLGRLSRTLKSIIETSKGGPYRDLDEQAMAVVLFAQKEARESGHNFVGTEQILLGLTAQQNGIAGKALASKGVTLDNARAKVISIIGTGAGKVAENPPLTPAARLLLKSALKEAKRMGRRTVGAEHLLLGMMAYGGGVGNRVLEILGIDDAALRNAIFRLVEAGSGESEDG